MLVFLGLAYIFTKTSVFTALVNNSLTLPDKMIIYLVFASFCILGTVLSEPSNQFQGAIANTRTIGAILGGLLGGPLVGLLIGLTGGLYRLLSMACFEGFPYPGTICSQDDPVNFIDLACVVSTTFDGFFAGCVHYFQSRRGRIETLFSPKFVFLVAFTAEVGHIIINLSFGWYAQQIPQTLNLLYEIAFPMRIANSIGVALIIYMIREQKNTYDIINSNATAWRIANKTAESMYSGFRESSQTIAQIIQQETKVSAVSITDTENILAFTGEGEDHHFPGELISNSDTKKAIVENQVIFIDGIEKSYHCMLKNNCQLGSALVIPLQNSENEVFGTIKLYESKSKLFRNINLALGKEIAQLLSKHFLVGDREQRKNLEAKEQLKLLQAQIKPHFLYNSLATIAAITQKQPDKARDLLLNLSDFFRANLKTPGDTSTLREEYKHLKSYLEIEKARYKDNLQVQINIPDELMDKKLPVFTLQPLVENAVEHGTSEIVQVGIVSISVIEQDEGLLLTVEDNAGLYTQPDTDANGIGLTLDKRIKLLYGINYGVSIECQERQWTKILVRLPNRNS
jgi:two-component system LytT family sensor kinase